jgi:hypothetical protein
MKILKNKLKAAEITKTITDIISESLLKSDGEVYYSFLKDYNALLWHFYSSKSTNKGLAIIKKLCQTGNAVGKTAYIPGPIYKNEVKLDMVGSSFDSDRSNKVIKIVIDELKRNGFTKIVSYYEL